MSVRNQKKPTYTPEQKQAYKEQKETEKQQLYDLYEKFVTKKTLQELISTIANYEELHNYTLRNRFFVLSQAEDRNDSKFIGIINGFQNWKKQDISILKGSKAYKVIVPIFKKTQVTKLTENNEIKDQEENETKISLSYFKLGNVFDISQTSEFENYLQQQKEIDEKIMKNAEIGFDIALDFFNSHFPEVKLSYDLNEYNPEGKKGAYLPEGQHIILYEKTSHTLLHEIAHHIIDNVVNIRAKERAKNEVLAELGAYLLMLQFDANIEFNFKYSNVWSGRITDNFELPEFEGYYNKLSKSISNFFNN